MRLIYILWNECNIIDNIICDKIMYLIYYTYKYLNCAFQNIKNYIRIAILIYDVNILLTLFVL